MKQLLHCLLVSSLALTTQADTLYLRDGRTVHGAFLSGNNREIQFRPDGGTVETHTIGTVDRISFSGPDEGVRNRTESFTVPAGTTVTVRLIDPIDSDKTDEGETYRASLDEDWMVEGRTIAPRGADATVKVVRVDQSGTFSGREEVAIVLTELVANGRRYALDTNHAQLSAKSRKDQTVKIVGGSAVVGAIIGAIAGGGKGAAIGAATGAGAGAAVQAIRGQRVQIPSETKLDFTLAQPLRI